MSSGSAFYIGKTILAPMVKIGTLPSRLLALRYGADLVYTEEIIDWKFLRAQRVVNDLTHTIDYIDEYDGSVFFQTCDEERTKVVLQIGTCCPDRALKVAKLVQNDIFALDINMGCPKEFSMKGGMGAALLKHPEKIKSILTNLVPNVKIPITCKIRVLPSLEDTIKLVKMIETTGVAAIGIHGRTKDERPSDSNRNHYLKEIVNHVGIPVIANGGSKEIKVHSDIQKFREETNCPSVMIARAAEWNMSIFSPESKEEIHIVIRKYLRLAIESNTPFNNAKYTIQMMLRDQQQTELGQRLLASQTMEEVCDIWDQLDYYNQIQENFTKKRKFNNDNELKAHKKLKLSDDTAVIIVPDITFIRGHYTDTEALPRSILLKWSLKKLDRATPIYSTVGNDRRFQSTVTIGGQTFRTDCWERNKRCAEQAAALACIKYLSLVQN